MIKQGHWHVTRSTGCRCRCLAAATRRGADHPVCDPTSVVLVSLFRYPVFRDRLPSSRWPEPVRRGGTSNLARPARQVFFDEVFWGSLARKIDVSSFFTGARGRRLRVSGHLSRLLWRGACGALYPRKFPVAGGSKGGGVYPRTLVPSRAEFDFFPAVDSGETEASSPPRPEEQA